MTIQIFYGARTVGGISYPDQVISFETNDWKFVKYPDQQTKVKKSEANAVVLRRIGELHPEVYMLPNYISTSGIPADIYITEESWNNL